MALSKDFSLVAFSSFVNLAIGLVTTPIITRIALPADYGNWSLFNVFTNVIFLFCSLGYDQVLVRYFYEHDRDNYRKRLISISWFYPCLCATILIVPILLILDYFFLDWRIVVYILLWINILVSILNRITGIVLRFTDKVAYLSLFTIAHKAVYVACAVFLLLHIDDGFVALTLGTILSTIVVVISSIIVSRQMWGKPSFLYSDLKVSEYSRYGIPLMVASSVYMVFQTIDKLVIKSFCSPEQLGIYASATSLIALLAIVQSSFNTVWWPAVMKKYEQNPTDTSFYVKANNIISAIMLTLGVMMILFKDIIVLFLGPRYREASVFIPFLMFQPIMYTISETTVLGLTFLKKSKIQLYISLLACCCNLLLCIVLTRYWGTQGTSIAVGTSYIFFFVVRTLWSNKYYKIPIPFSKLCLGILLLYLFAIYETFHASTLVSYCIALLLLITIALLYRNSMLEILHYIHNKILRK